MNIGWICRACIQHLPRRALKLRRQCISTSQIRSQQSAGQSLDGQTRLLRNIGIIAHIDAGKTTTTERMLYYSGFTRRIGNVDEGSTVTDFLPAERARGITIQSAAITLHWPSQNLDQSLFEKAQDAAVPESTQRHTINLIDTPGHADFTFEVIRSLRILDGAVCILDGVAGVEAQTEKVWHQANNYKIPRILYVNKLDRDGAAFNRTVKEIASRLHTFPALCQIPWWKDGKFVGVGDVVELRALQWEEGGDGSTYKIYPWDELAQVDSPFRDEMQKARVALVESLTELDEDMVEHFLEADEDMLAIPAPKVWSSLRKCLLESGQALTPVFAGASFRNIGVQPLLNAVNALLPCPQEAPDPDVSLGKRSTTLRTLLSSTEEQLRSLESPSKTNNQRKPSVSSSASKPAPLLRNLTACALAFKVVNDPRRGVLVYVRVYHGTVARNNLLYNTNLAVSERALRLVRMYASEAVEIDSISTGQIGVIAGLKHARTGDTLIVCTGATVKNGPPAPIDTMQLRPIDVPPALFFTSIEPSSLSEERHLNEAMGLLLREDPSLHVSQDAESGQTHLSGMGELHLEIARDRLIGDFKVKATMGKIEISYREALTASSADCTELFDREVAGKQASASCTARVSPLDETSAHEDLHSRVFDLGDANLLTIYHPTLDQDGKSRGEGPALPPSLPLGLILSALQTGVTASLARGPSHRLPVHSTNVTITFNPATDLTPTTTPAALSSAARMAVHTALKAAAASSPTVLMEPVMLATIAVPEEAMGNVVHDISSARGGHVLSLDADADAEEATSQGDAGRASGPSSAAPTSSPAAATAAVLQTERLSSAQLARVYAPSDPFGDADVGGTGSGSAGARPPRQIKARVPLKEMVGYLKHLRSLTGGRGTFVMAVEGYERMGTQRQKVALAEMGSAFV